MMFHEVDINEIELRILFTNMIIFTKKIVPKEPTYNWPAIIE